MERIQADTVKHREIRFSRINPNAGYAHSATLLLEGIDGILRAHPQEPHILQVSYDISYITLNVIDEALIELGYHLDNTLMSKLLRALYYYTEENQRINLGLESGQVCNRQVFINRYQRLQHGCRDERPEYWRNYL